MINEDPNMGRKQIFSELPLPSKVEEKGISNLIYKGVFVAVKLLLDIRLNLVKISEGQTIKTKHKQVPYNKKVEKPVDNAVIKSTDDIKIDEKIIESNKDSIKKDELDPTPEKPKPEEPKVQNLEN